MDKTSITSLGVINCSQWSEKIQRSFQKVLESQLYKSNDIIFLISPAKAICHIAPAHF